MASLQDQLLKAGLTSETKVKQLKSKKRKQAKQQRKQNQPVIDETKEQFRQRQVAQAEKDRILNQQKQAEAELQQIKAQIKQLIEQNKLQQDSVEGTAFNFTDQNTVKSIYVTQDIREQITKGVLAIVKCEHAYEVVHSTVAEKIKLRDQSHVIVLNEKSDNSNENDPYADYQVPDDLIW